MRRLWIVGVFLMAGAVYGRGEDLASWWEGSQGSGQWLGLRPKLEDRGLTLSGSWTGSYIGIVDGGLQRGGSFEEELRFGAKVDFAKLSGWEALEGLTATVGVRWRDGVNANIYAGASPVFNPAVYQSGLGWRLMPFYVTYEMPEAFGIKKLFTISGGWQDPYEHFLSQKGSKLFRNNMIVSSKGITANGVGWSSSYAAWGGYLKVAPAEWYYVQGGLYMAIPEGAASSNHGLDLAGSQSGEPNGLFAIGEAGFTPKIGSMPGKYALGGYYWGLETPLYTGGSIGGRWGLYLQAEQLVWQEPTFDAADGKSDGKADGKATVKPLPPGDQGLSLLAYFYFAPPAENALPFYFHAGTIYKGLVPTRDDDELGIIFGFGEYSHAYAHSEDRIGMTKVHDYEGVLECDYRCKITQWASVQPFVQYIIRPGGRNMVPNATVLGVNFALTF